MLNRFGGVGGAADRPADAGTLSTNWRWPPEQAAGNRRTAGVNGFATCRLWRQPVAFGGERAAHLSRPPDGREKRFCPLLGLRPKGGAARHPCSIVLNMAAPHTWERFGCQTIDSILLPDTRQATYFCKQTKVCKSCFFRLASRGKRNRRRFRRRGSS